MTTDHLPARRIPTTLAIRQPANAPQPVKPQVSRPMPLSTGLLIASGVPASMAALSEFGAHRHGQAALLGGLTLVALYAAVVERYREGRS